MDDKKIEDAAKQHSEESYISDYFQACYKDAFMDARRVFEGIRLVKSQRKDVYFYIKLYSKDMG